MGRPLLDMHVHMCMHMSIDFVFHSQKGSQLAQMN